MPLTIEELLKKEKLTVREECLLITLLDRPIKQELKKEPATSYEQLGEFCKDDVSF